VKLVQRQLGHLTATMTLDRYGHLFPDELDAPLKCPRRTQEADSGGFCADSGQSGRRSHDRHIASYLGKRWWGGQDLNLRPTDYESAALTN
jgi:hypothetical protein